MLIINADDWGRSVAETDAALKCFRERRITSVSAMVFMLDSKRAAKLTKDYELDDVGLHLNFSEEFTDKSCSKTLKETQGRIIRFLKRSKYAQLLYNPFLGEAFASSYRAQVEEFMRLFEKLPSHIDGHHHMHLCANLLLGKSIPAGTYSLFLIPRSDKSAALIINKQTGQWGTKYDENQDLVRVDMKGQPNTSSPDQLTISVEKIL